MCIAVYGGGGMSGIMFGSIFATSTLHDAYGGDLNKLPRAMYGVIGVGSGSSGWLHHLQYKQP